MARSKIENGAQAAAGAPTLRERIRDGIKWWAEHQAWPATDEVRIDRHRSGCL